MSRVFLPGFGLTSGMYTSLEAAQDARTIDTPCLESWQGTIDAISAVCEKDDVLIGYSQGGRLALSTALDGDVSLKGLVLISSHAGLQDDEKTQRASEDESLVELELNEIYTAIDAKNVFASPSSEPTSERITDVAEVRNQLSTLGLGSMPYLEDRLVELRIPVLYVSGSRDGKYTTLAARYKKKTPFSHHRVLDSDHRVPMNAPHTLLLLIDWFEAHVI